ncbi:MAG: BMP family ABC transporter substrate-binding protein, partial [Oscillospiraceae bacterium]|nr:BMP family ABC transporter substrate-binding protein [Oscillospiraceae bacterium]
MKKFLALVMAMAMTLSLVACGSTPAASSAPAADADLTVGAIYINSKNDTAGYTFAHHNGIVNGMKKLGLDPEKQLFIVDEVPEDKQQVLSAVDTLVGQGADIIFGISFGYIDAMEEAAAEYTDVIFSHGTGYKSNETNFNN